VNVTFDHVQTEADNIASFYFRPERPLPYTAGQFIELTVKHAHPDDRGERRWFTLSSSPSHELLSITTKFAAKDGSSFKKALRKLQAGDTAIMSDSMGDFVLPKLIQTPLIFVAGGIGITPFHSMLQSLAASGEQRSIKLLIGVRNESEIVFQETFDRAKQHATIVVNEPSAAWGGQRGQLSAELILSLEPLTEDTLVYVSGPEEMVEALRADLLKAGLKKRQFVGDFFPNYGTI
jgi:ferredoxin-NADP reductase